MEYIKLEVDDSYINEMAEYFEEQGKQLQDMADSYIAIMKRVTGEGIVKGEVSDALNTFVVYAENEYLHVKFFTCNFVNGAEGK